MPFYCGYCSRWVESKHKFCPTCGRPRSGRLCRRCKSKVPTTATHCPGCGGSDRLTEPAVRGWRPPRALKLALVMVLLPTAWLLVGLLTPLVQVAWRWTLELLAQAFGYGLAVWFATALLPRPTGQKVRKAAWWMIRQLARVIGNLFA